MRQNCGRRRWLHNWPGAGWQAVGLHRTGYDLDLRQYGDGSAWEPTVWRAVHRAGGDALKPCETAF